MEFGGTSSAARTRDAAPPIPLVDPAWPTDQRPASLFELRSISGRLVTPEQLAAVPGPLITLAVGLLCVVLGLSVIWKGEASETAAGFWPPAGAALVALIVVPTRRWGWVFAGVLFPTIIGFAFGIMPVSAGVLWALGNCIEPALAALAVRWFLGWKGFSRGRFLLFFVAVAVVAAPMVGGAIGGIGTVVGYGDPWLDVWLEWILGDGLGVLVVTPFLLSYAPRGSAPRTRGERVAFVVLIAGATGLAFADIGPNGAALLPYLMLVGLIWAGMRFGTRSVAAAGFVVALGANIATSLRLGPFSETAGSADVITLQIFIAIALITSFVVASMAGDLADRNEVRRLLRHQATHDPLTGLPNRVLFGEWLDAALAARSGSGSSVAVLLVDLDDFKKVNDRYGFPAGDLTLRAAAGLLAGGIRPGNLLARLGGDEFGVLVDDLDGPDAAMDLARELIGALAQRIEVGANQFLIGGTVGIAIAGAHAPITAADLLHRADLASHHVKHMPGLDAAVFDEAIEARTRRTVEVAEELRGAIDRGELRVEYQPVVCLASGAVTEFEVLARWTNRRFGVVTPDEFIAVAEDTGFVSRIGDWVLEVACAQLADWRSLPSHGDIRLAVNVSARQLSDPTFPERVRRILVAAKLPAAALTLEITETAVMDDVEVSGQVLADLRDSGLRLSMDDFGTGYSSMSNLRRTPLHVLKIDRSFVDGLGVVATDTAIVESIINLGHSFGLEVVAEGVESATQLGHLVRLGCDYGQGYLWSRSVDPGVAAALLGQQFELPVAASPPSTDARLAQL